jgi:hypothetical protein
VADLLPKGSDGKPLGHVPEIRYDVVDLPAWDFDNLVGGTVLRLALGMLHKMTGGNLDEFPEALKPLLEITDEGQRVELSKELLDFVAKAFQAHDRRLDNEMVHESLKQIFKGKERTMIKTIFEEREDIGEARGIARGKAEAVLTVLRRKFKKIPKHIEQSGLAMSDPIALESLLGTAIDSDTLEGFVEIL